MRIAGCMQCKGNICVCVYIYIYIYIYTYIHVISHVSYIKKNIWSEEQLILVKVNDFNNILTSA
jgi:hypothetical protein